MGHVCGAICEPKVPFLMNKKVDNDNLVASGRG